MAPHAQTPTTERDELFNSIHGTQQINSSLDSATSSNLSGDSNGHNNHPGTAQNTSHNHDSNLRVLTDRLLNDSDSGTDNNSPATRYEDAYIHGYKEGYTSGYIRSNIELKHQPIAIVGMSCRFPGNVSTPDEFWELLARSRTGFSAIPPSRFSANRFVHPNPGKGGTTNAHGGNFLTHDLKAFDAPFFGFTQQEAISLDPQQRLLLECTLEALESAGIPKHSIVGKDVGVFVGGTFSEYEAELFRDSETIPMHQATGCAMAMQSNRISHFFDLRGPSFTVDTACSSSLVAIHNACQSLRNGESSMAIAAGVHLNMLPEFWISYSMSRLFGEAGRSFAFDQRGTGYGRGEGCGMILLKPLEQAIKDNDPIRAVITGSGINQDGRTPGITMPNGSAQEALIRSVYKNADMDPRDTGYIEAHGTGTRVGDPIEVSALHNVFGDGRTKRKPLYIGSVKSNIGHLEAAAGIAGVIKTALMLERGFVLPNYDFKQPNEKIPFDEWGVKVPVKQQPWPFGKKWASVNGFGFGGTNAHVVMTRGPLERKTMKEEIDTKASERLFVISANDKSSTENTMQNLGVYLERRPEVFQNDLLSNLAYTLGQRKSLHQFRVAITASSSKDLVESLFSGKVIPTRQEFEELRFGWIFTGQGAQWWAMGRELAENYPIYATALEKADAQLRAMGADFSLLVELSKDESDTQVNAAHISQPACTAVQLALVDLLRAWGITPSAVAGHSSGEIGAAYAAQFITFEDAMTIAYHRGRLVPLLKKKYLDLDGSMMAVGAGPDIITPLIDRIPHTMGEVRIACINSPSSITASGDTKAITKLQELIEEAHPGMFARKLQVDTAYHSHHMNLVAKAYTESLMNLQIPKESPVRFHSSLLGRLATSAELDATYWVQNLVCPVRFNEAVQSMCSPTADFKTGVNFMVELGPHAALQGPIKQILKHVGGPASKLPYSSVLSRKKNAITTALQMASTLFVKGASLDMGAINFPKPLDRSLQVLTDLPRYAWNHSSTFYHESRLTQVHKFDDMPRNDLIGILAPYSNDFEPTWRNIIRLDDLPWLRHHQIQGVTIFPISGFVAMALEAAAQRAIREQITYDRLEVKGLKMESPAMLTEEDLELTISLRPCPETFDKIISHKFHIRSWSKSKGWMQHCTGTVSIASADMDEVNGVRAQRIHSHEIRSKSKHIGQAASSAVRAAKLYQRLSDMGVSYGEAFQGLQYCDASSTASVAHIRAADTVTEMPHGQETKYFLHPTLLERLISMYWPIFDATGLLDTVHLPNAVDKVVVSANILQQFKEPNSSLKAYCEPSTTLSNDKPNTLSMFALDSAGQMMISVENLLISPIHETKLDSAADVPRELCYKQEWEDMPSPSIPQSNGITPPKFTQEIVIIHDESQPQINLASTLSNHLTAMTGTTPTTGTLSQLAPYSKSKLCIFLPELSQPLLSSLEPESFSLLQTLLTTVDAILWVVRGAYTNATNPNANMIYGLSRTLRSEGTLMRFITLDLDPGSEINVDSILKVLSTTCDANSAVEETEFMERGGKILTPRIVDDGEMNEYVHKVVYPSSEQPARFLDMQRPLRGTVPTPGVFDRVAFEDDHEARKVLADYEVDIQVKAVGLSSKDGMEESKIGVECSGVVVGVGANVSNIMVGDRVAAITPKGSLATIARAQSRFVIRIPEHVTFEEAAAMSVAYCTAIHALLDQAELVEGETVLIHDAASAVGQALLIVAQMIGAEIWTTVKTLKEKTILMREFGVPENRIWSLSSAAVADSIMVTTKGHGVDVVINTIAEVSVLRTSGLCISNFGRIVNANTGPANLETVQKVNVAILSTDMAAIATYRPKVLQRIISDVARLLRHGKIQAIQHIKAFGITSIVEAFESLKGLHGNGLAVIVPQDDEMAQAPRLKNQHKILRRNATYILIGGTGGLGRSMAKWMVNNGAKHIVLLSRSGTLKGAGADQINALNKAGANIVVRSCNVADRADVNKLMVEGLTDMPPVRGIIHGAMVLHDVLFEKMTYEQYSSVVASKVQGAWNFHHALTAANAILDFVVCISSAAGAVGNRGQAAYAAANTFLNGFAQHLRTQGISASSIDLTAVSDAGYLAEDKEKAAEVARNLGSDTICEAEVLALIQAAIKGDLTSCNGHPITGMRVTMRPFWCNDAKFTHLLQAAEAASASSGTTKAVCWSTAFKAAASRADAEQVVSKALVDKIAEVISMEPEALETTRALSHYPLDSLTAIEVRNFITRMFEANLQVLELLASGSIENLARIVCAKSKCAVPAAEN